MSLLDISIFSAMFTATIAAVILTYLALLDRERHVALWAVGMLVFAGSFGADLVYLRRPDSMLALALTAITYLTSGALFLAGSQRYMARRRAPVIAWIPAAIAFVIALVLGTQAGWLALVASALYLSGACLHTCFVIVRSSAKSGIARHMSGYAFLALALLSAVRPLIREFAPSVHADYFVAAVFALAVGLGALFMYVRLFRARILDSERRVVRQSALLDQVAEGIIGLDSEFRVTAWNKACERMYGIEARDALGLPVMDVIPGDFISDSDENLFGGLDEQGELSWLMHGRNKDGDEVYFEVAGRRVGENSAAGGYVGVMRDVTSRVRAQAQLNESRERYRTLFESSPIPLWDEDFSQVKEYLDELRASGIEDVAGHFEQHPEEVVRCVSRIRIRDVNDTAVRMYGARNKEEFLGGLGPFVGDGTIDVFAREFAALARGATTFSGQIVSHTFSGEARDILFTLAVTPGCEDTLERVLVSDIDLTERTRVEEELEIHRAGLEELVERRTEQLQSAYQELQKATRAKDRLLANVSHEMRTPLNSIIGFTGVVAQGLAGEIPEEAQRQLTMANRSGRQLLSLVNDLLDFSQLEGGSIPLEMQQVDVKDLLATACEVVRPIAQAKGLEIQCPGPVEAPIITTDPDRVRQILLNLLSNAVKFTETGFIAIRVQNDDRWLYVDVVDTGPGIPEVERPHIFDAFYQLTPTREAKHSGVGLGLAIAFDLAKMLGGRVLLERSSQEGSIFRLLLPLK